MASNSDNTPNNKLGLTTDPRVNPSAILNSRSTTSSRVVVVGIYGLPGSGKTFLLDQLRHEHSKELFKFYDGSQMIANVTPGGLEAFQRLEEGGKVQCPQVAIDTIRNECANSGRVAVVAGHSYFGLRRICFSVILDGGLRACQVVLPRDASPRLDTKMLPLISMVDPEFLDPILRHRSRHVGIQIHHPTDRNGTKLLMTPMRGANVRGLALREIHRRVGHYLATESLTQVLGIEEFSISHVQGHDTSSYRLLNEPRTLIVALMHSGEPIALRINDIFPLAMFLHASYSEDIKSHYLQAQSTVVLVDSVVNNDTTVVQFEQHVRELNPSRIALWLLRVLFRWS